MSTLSLSAARDLVAANGDDFDSVVEAVCTALTDFRAAMPDNSDDLVAVRFDLARAPGLAGVAEASIAAVLAAFGDAYFSEVTGRPVRAHATRPTVVTL